MTKKELIRALNINGITKGSKVLLHSSFKAVAFEGTPEDVCYAFMETIGDEGLLVMPAHSLNFRNHPEVKGPYDSKSSRSRVGAISDAFWKIPGVFRSMHPTHSDAAWGKGAEYLVNGHEKADTVGVGSPLEKFSRTDGKIFMMGCRLSSCTMGHVAEWVAEVPYKTKHFAPEWGFEADYIDIDGQLKTYVFKTTPGCGGGFVNAKSWLADAGVLREISLNKEVSYIFSASEYIKILLEKLKEDPFALSSKDEVHLAKCNCCKTVNKMQNK